VVGLVVAGNVAWMIHDHQAPPWDQAHYLHLSFAWRRAWHTGGLHRLVSSVYNTDPERAPLYVLLITPLEAQWNGVTAALVANTMVLSGVIVASARVAARLFGGRAAVLTAIFVATCALLDGLSRTALVDVLLVLLVTLAVLAAVESQGFRRRGWALAFGAFTGLAMLTKLTAPAFVLLPAALTMGLSPRFVPRRQLANLLLGLGLAVGLALPWYAVNLGPSLDYLQSTTNGALAIGTTAHPLTWHAFQRYLIDTINLGVGAILVVLLVGVGALAAVQRRRQWDRQTLVRISIPLSWFAIGFLALAAAHNQDIRYLAPGIPGLAILAAGSIGVLRPPRLQLAIATVATVALAWQFVSYVAPVSQPGVAELAVGPPSFRLSAPLDGRVLDYARRYGLPDYATPIVKDLARAGRRLGARSTLTVCLLESQEVVNGNTLGYVAESRGVSLSFVDVSYIPRFSQRELTRALEACPVALLIRSKFGSGRIAVLNRSSAAARLTATDLRLFSGPRPHLPVGQGATVEILERGR